MTDFAGFSVLLLRDRLILRARATLGIRPAHPSLVPALFCAKMASRLSFRVHSEFFRRLGGKSHRLFVIPIRYYAPTKLVLDTFCLRYHALRKFIDSPYLCFEG
jgi:hypothetical protein